MNENPLEKAVTLALHYTDRAKALKGKPAARAIHVHHLELYWYTKAAVELNEIYLDCTDPNTVHLYPLERRQVLAEQYAFQVECMIYRMQQILIVTPKCHPGYRGSTYILNALNNVSGLFLPLAVPGQIVVEVKSKPSIPQRPPDKPYCYPQENEWWPLWIVGGIILIALIIIK